MTGAMSYKKTPCKEKNIDVLEIALRIFSLGQILHRMGDIFREPYGRALQPHQTGLRV